MRGLFNIQIKSLAVLLLTLVGTFARAQKLPERTVQPDDTPVTFKADTYKTNFDTGVMTLSGNVDIFIGDQTMHGNNVELNNSTGELRALDGFVFEQGKMTIRGEKAFIQMKTGLGEFHQAVLTLKDEFYLEARVLNRYESMRYKATNAKLSSCLDCPKSWSIVGSTVDVEVEGYAEIHHALLQVKDMPFTYIPVFYFPVKTKRQSGLLVPRPGRSPNLGWQISVPYYWAIDDFSDTTIQYRYMTFGGHRVHQEFRYRLSNRTFTFGEASILQNPFNASLPKVRGGFSFRERLQLSRNWTQRFTGEWTSDSTYSTDFNKEFLGARLPSLVTEPSLSYQVDNFHAYTLLKINEDNVSRDAEREGSIHKLPEIGLAVPSSAIWQSLRGTVAVKEEYFHRPGSGFDEGSDWIRSGNRTMLKARANAPLNLLSSIDYEPSAELTLGHYIFDSVPAGQSSDAARGRILVDQRLSSTVWRVYSSELGNLRAVRHSIEPSLKWSFSPDELASNHDFFNNATAPRFDLFDPRSPDLAQIQLGTQGEEQRYRSHHLLTMGLGTRVVGRYGEQDRTYEEFLGANVEQDVSLRPEYDANGAPVSRWSRLKLRAFGAFGGGRVSTNMAIDVTNGDTDMFNEASYTWSYYILKFIHHVQPGTLTFGYGAGITNFGPWTVSSSGTYNYRTNQSAERYSEQAYNISYDSPSKCWFFTIAVTKKPDQSAFSYDPTIGPIFRGGVRTTFF